MCYILNKAKLGIDRTPFSKLTIHRKAPQLYHRRLLKREYGYTEREESSSGEEMKKNYYTFV
jgi:hypothetical protein